MLEEKELRNKLHFLFTWLLLRALRVTQQRYSRKQKESTSFTRHIYIMSSYGIRRSEEKTQTTFI